jgi:exopolysaccharide production protein ExoZ
MKTESLRVEGFDLLRGLCAIAVLYYHMFYWLDAARLYNFGRYGVYVFFVLSGASMYVAYADKFFAGYRLDKYLILRFARLAPLYVLIALVAGAIALATHKYSSGDSAALFFLNASFFFGFGNPGVTSTVTGGWSLGIEAVFYLIFPVLAAFVRGRGWWLLLALAFIAQHAFIGFTLPAGGELAPNWIPYTQFLSFVFYFVAGCVIGKLVIEKRLKSSVLWWPAFLAGLLAFSLYHIEGNVAGPLGWAWSLLAVAITAASAGLPLGGVPAYLASLLGKMSYGLYLIHPFVYSALKRLVPALLAHPVLFATAVFLITAAIALVLEARYEMPLRNWIKSRMDRPATNPAVPVRACLQKD